MINITIQKRDKSKSTAKKRRGPKLGTRLSKMPWARMGTAAGGVGIMGVTASWNMRGWVATASTDFDRVSNLLLSGSMELMGACAVAAAAHQWERDRVRGGALAAAGAALFIFNTQAAQTNLAVQWDAAQNHLETAQAAVGNVQADIEEWRLEQASIMARYGNTIPRTRVAIESVAGDVLAQTHRPVAVIEGEINAAQQSRRWTSTKGCSDATLELSRTFCERYYGLEGELGAAREAQALSAETADRAQYDVLRAKIRTARLSMTADQVAANDEVRSVVPETLRVPFIYALQAVQAGLFWAVASPAKAKPGARTPAAPAPANNPAPARRALSPEERDRRRKFAIARRYGARGGDGPGPAA